MADTDVEIDRAAVRRLVEDFWRSLFLFGYHAGQARPHINQDEFARDIREMSRRFAERNEATAAPMPPDRAASFLRMIEEEDRICFEERQRDPDEFWRRLGLNPQNPAPVPTPIYQRQSIGEIALRTAVRASIWELIFSIFRR